MDTTGTVRRSRQLPGLACEECRRRKLRCDRERPQCGECVESGKECIVNHARSPRGPKKANAKALQSCLGKSSSDTRSNDLEVTSVSSATLERNGFEQQRRGRPQSQHARNQHSTLEVDFADTQNEHLSSFDLLDEDLTDEDVVPLVTPSASESRGQARTIGHAKSPPSALSAPSLDSVTQISEMAAADLDQLYFDRVHTFFPIFNRRCYATWSRQSEKPPERICLRYAMWTVASSMSSQFHSVCDTLYNLSRQKLDELERGDTASDASLMGQAQSWILLALYDSTRSQQRRAWLSAGRCFRLVQLMKLHELDTLGDATSTSTVNSHSKCVELEEKRRLFWMAFCLDRFASMSEMRPLTLDEHAIMTRLPAPESEFQASRPCATSFLSEVLAGTEQMEMSHFAESIAMIAMYGRALCHRQQSAVEQLYGDALQDFWSRHHWLDSILTNRIQVLSKKAKCPSNNNDPMLLFTSIVAHATVLSLCKAIKAVPWHTDEYKILILNYEQRCLSAAQDIVTLARESQHNTFFYVHPFTPLPLCICADFLKTYRNLDASLNAQLLEVLQILRRLKDVNNLAANYLSTHDLEIQVHQNV